MDDKESGGPADREISPKMALKLNEFGEIVDNDDSSRSNNEPEIRFDEYGELINAPQINTQPGVEHPVVPTNQTSEDVPNNTKKVFSKPTRGDFDR